jgi:hypothetical protein
MHFFNNSDRDVYSVKNIVYTYLTKKQKKIKKKNATISSMRSILR